MKADQATQKGVIQAFKEMFEAYKKKNTQGVLNCWASDPDIVMIGSGKDEKSVGVEKFVESLTRDWEQANITAIDVKDFSVSVSGNVAWLSSDLTFNYTVKEKALQLAGRLTGVMEKRNGKWLWMQMHYSVPNVNQKRGQSWPKK